MIKKTLLLLVTGILFFSLSVKSVTAQSDKKKEASDKLPVKYEPSPSHPYGKLNPAAQAETNQFSFMIGEFDCASKIVNQKGQWGESKIVWNSTYFLNGSGIQDKLWGGPTVASGTRIFNKQKGKWIVNYFQTFPSYFAGVWEGKKEGEKMIMRAPRGEKESRLTFHNITKQGFDWIGETVTKDGKATPFWIISCKRRR